MSETQQFDVIIIGAGLGGLSSALEVSRKGKKVLLLEQHNLPGGFSTSFVRGRFEFEPALHELANKQLPDLTNGAVAYVERLGLNIHFQEINEAYRLILTEQNLDVVVPHDLDKFIDLVGQVVPGSRESVEQYFKLSLEIRDAFMALSTGEKTKNSTLLKEHGNFIRAGSATAQEVADRLGVPRKAQDIIHAYWCYAGTPTSKLSFHLWCTMLVQYLSAPPVFARDRSHEISEAFIDKIREYGGTVLFNSLVESINVDKRKVIGVTLSNGQTFHASNIISNTSPTNVFTNLIKPALLVPKIAFKNINARKRGLSFVVVYLGLDIDHRELDLNEYSYFISPHMDTEKLYENAFEMDRDEFFIAAVCLNAAHPECSPPGTTILSLSVLTGTSSWNDVKDSDYFKLKQNLAKKIIQQFEKTMKIDIQSHIEEIEIATPQTFARYTGSYDGAVYGYQTEPWDSLVPRFLSWKKETYFKGLYFCGGHTDLSHGYGSSILSGQVVAERLFAEENR